MMVDLRIFFKKYMKSKYCFVKWVGCVFGLNLVEKGRKKLIIIDCILLIKVELICLCDFVYFLILGIINSSLKRKICGMSID